MRYILSFLLLFGVIYQIQAFAAGDEQFVTEPVHAEALKDIPENFSSLFLSASLSARLLNEVTWDASYEYRPLQEKGIEVSRAALHEYYPWIEHLLYPEKAPRLFSVNRWETSPEVTFLFAHDFTPLGDASSVPFILTVGNERTTGVPTPESVAFSASKAFQTLQSFVSESVQTISSAMGMRLSVKKTDRPTIGAIHIVFVSNNTLGGTGYKMPHELLFSVLDSYTNKDYIDFRGAYGLEQDIPHALIFSPGFDNRVDGYFVTNERNEIEFSICYIWYGHQIEVLKSLTLECLVRSMGFPGNIRSNKSRSILSNWTEPKAARDVVASKDDANLSDLDKKLLSTLYSPNIQAGMSAPVVRDILRNVSSRKEANK